MKDCKLTNRLYVVEDGAQALSYLRKEGEYSDVMTPDLILLDLNLPKVDGREVLSQIKANPETKDIPVIVMTVSKAEQDLLKAQDLQVHDYLTKPIDLEQLVWAMRYIESFWFTVVKVS